MRVHALFGGGTWIKLLLWSSWVVYVIATMVLLSIGLWHGQGEFYFFCKIFLASFRCPVLSLALFMPFSRQRERIYPSYFEWKGSPLRPGSEGRNISRRKLR